MGVESGNHWTLLNNMVWLAAVEATLARAVDLPILYDEQYEPTLCKNADIFPQQEFRIIPDPVLSLGLP